jgi:hypothetical protein
MRFARTAGSHHVSIAQRKLKLVRSVLQAISLLHMELALIATPNSSINAIDVLVKMTEIPLFVRIVHLDTD